MDGVKKTGTDRRSPPLGNADDLPYPQVVGIGGGVGLLDGSHRGIVALGQEPKGIARLDGVKKTVGADGLGKGHRLVFDVIVNIADAGIGLGQLPHFQTPGAGDEVQALSFFCRIVGVHASILLKSLYLPPY